MALTQSTPQPPLGENDPSASGAAPPSGLLGGTQPIAPVFVGALLLIFLGERIVTSDGLRLGLSGLGVAIAAGVTVLRFVRAQQLRGERRWAERTMALLSAHGLAAIGLYFSTTDAGRKLVGIASASPEKRALFDGVVTSAWIAGVLIALAPMILGEIALAPMRNAKVMEARRVRWAVGAGFSVAFATVYTALFVYAAGTLDAKVDFSYFRTARPSESTRNIALAATGSVKVMAFFPQLNEVGTEVDGYLKELAAGAANVKVESYDRLLVPAIAKDAKVSSDGVLVLSRGNSKETLSIGTDIKSAASKLKTLDADFQKSLIKVMREAKTAYVTVGHGELNEGTATGAAEGRTAKGLRKLLESQNYLVKDLGLAEGLGTDVPADATLVMVVGPEKALLPEEIATLKRYAENGGHVLAALDPESKADHGPFADAFGLTWKPTVLAHDKLHVRVRYNDSDRAMIVTNRFSSHASVSTLSRNSSHAPLIFGRASYLDKKDGGDLKVDFAVKSMPETWADENGNFQLDSPPEKRSSYNLAAAVSKAVPAPEGYKGKDPPEERAFVTSDADCFSDAAFGNEPNVIFALDVIRWLGGEESFSGAIATTEDVRIEHTKQKDVIWFWGIIAGAPALVLGLGVVANRKRKAPKASAKEKKA